VHLAHDKYPNPAVHISAIHHLADWKVLQKRIKGVGMKSTNPIIIFNPAVHNCVCYLSHGHSFQAKSDSLNTENQMWGIERTKPYPSPAVHIFPIHNPFLFIKNKRLFISSEGLSTLEKNALICYQREMLPIQSGVTALCRQKWQFGALIV
jgi:hypothetical protein